MYVEKTFTFEASHQIANHPGKCRRLHGHSWVLTVTCSGKLDKETKMVRDFYDIKQAVQPIIDRIDHQHLGHGTLNAVVDEAGNMDIVCLRNTVEGMSYGFLPTSENLLIWIASQLDPELPWCRLRLNETCTSSAILERWEYLRYSSKEGGNQHGRQEKRRQEGNEEGQEVSTEGKEVTPFITDDDIPF